MRQLVVVCLLAAAARAAPAVVPVHGLRLWAAPDHTRVVLDVGAHVKYRVFRLTAPERVVVDVEAARLEGPAMQPAPDSPRVRRVRWAHHGERGLRVVLDLKRPVEVVHRVLPANTRAGERLVVDLRDPARHAAAPAPPPRPRPLRDLVVAIDAGHGGEDPGASGPHGTREKDVVLDIARRLARLVDDTPGLRAVLIRKGDYYVGLRQRMALARRARADLFVSIHADAFRDRRVRGSSVYVLSPRGASSEAARWLAEQENAADLVGGVELSDKDDVLKSVLLDLSQTATLEASMQAARAVLSSLARVGQVHRRDVQRAGFVVLKSPDVPSLLVETAFISNPGEERKLASAAHRQRLAEAIYRGVRDHLRRTAPPGTRLAARRHRIASGETLGGIARRYAVSTESLRALNGLPDGRLRAGDLLLIP